MKNIILTTAFFILLSSSLAMGLNQDPDSLNVQDAIQARINNGFGLSNEAQHITVVATCKPRVITLTGNVISVAEKQKVDKLTERDAFKQRPKHPYRLQDKLKIVPEN